MEEILERVEGNPNYYVLRRYVESSWWNQCGKMDVCEEASAPRRVAETGRRLASY